MDTTAASSTTEDDESDSPPGARASVVEVESELFLLADCCLFMSRPTAFLLTLLFFLSVMLNIFLVVLVFFAQSQHQIQSF